MGRELPCRSSENSVGRVTGQYGVGFSDFREAYRGFEACDAFWFGGFLIAAALMVGRNAHLKAAFKVYPNVFLVNVGASGRARKSSAQEAALQLILQDNESGVEVSNGIGSAEGLIDLLKGVDGSSRRVLVKVGELSRLLRKGRQEATNSLIPTLTELYDCPLSIRIPNRKNDLTVREPFLCVSSSSTEEWLHKDMSVDDARAGFAGRFLYLVGSERPPVAIPKPPDTIALTGANDCLENLRCSHKTPKAYQLSQDAQGVHERWYADERSRRYPSPLLEVVAQRLQLHALKLALIYAAIEGCSEITQEQMEVAQAFADYQRMAQEHVLSGLGEGEGRRLRNRLLACLQKHGPSSRRELQQRVRHADAQDFAQALQQLQRMGAVEQLNTGRRSLYTVREY